jgi:hypothetical protein
MSDSGMIYAGKSVIDVRYSQILTSSFKDDSAKMRVILSISYSLGFN